MSFPPIIGMSWACFSAFPGRPCSRLSGLGFFDYGSFTLRCPSLGKSGARRKVSELTNCILRHSRRCRLLVRARLSFDFTSEPLTAVDDNFFFMMALVLLLG